MSLNTTIKEYSKWIREDFVGVIKWVKPSLLQNVQEVKFINDGCEVIIWKQDLPYKKFPDDIQMKRLKWDSEDYFYVQRMDTFQPWKNVPVGWPIYDSYYSQFDWEDTSRTDAITLALVEIGIHEALEWITVTEMGLPDVDNEDFYYGEWEENIPDDLPWPHNLQTIKAEAKLNDKWYPLSISF